MKNGIEKKLTALEVLGKQIQTTDHHLIRLLARRIQLAQAVCRSKLIDGQSLFRQEIEENRLQEVEDLAKREGISPHFARATLYSIIGESCKQQAIIRDRWHQTYDPSMVAKSFDYSVLRSNLLTLTNDWATRYDDEYGQDRFATKLQMEFEKGLISQEIEKLSRKKILVDLGCATGRETFNHSNYFAAAIGFDVSEDMITVANKKPQLSRKHPVSFTVCDVEKVLPLEDNSVSFVFMNNGTASDVKDISSVLNEIGRVLEKDGRFLFSFYNTDALLHEVFLPWPPSLMAEKNRDRQCLDVNYKGGRLSIYARPYTPTEVKDLFKMPLSIDQLWTHPTISSILPNELFEDSTSALMDVRKQIADTDRNLSENGNELGAYVIVTGHKV